MNIRPILALLLVAGLAGCSGSRSAATQSAPLPLDSATGGQGRGTFRPVVGATLEGNAVRFYVSPLIVPAPGTLQSIARFRAVVRRADGSVIDSLSTITIAPHRPKNTETDDLSVPHIATLEWDAPGGPAPGTSADLTVFDDRGTLLAAEHLLLDTLGTPSTPSQTQRSMDLQLDVRSMGGGVEFLVTATRRQPAPEGEYLTSGEKYRIELSTQLGEPIWSTNEGVAYTQDIREVEPKEVGDRALYRGFWNGRDPRTRKFASPGRYRVTVTIPARPIPYILHEEIQLGGDQ